MAIRKHRRGAFRGGGYSAYSFANGGYNDYFTRTTSLTGSGDSSTCSYGFWVKFNSDGTDEGLIYITGFRWRVYRNTSNQIQVLHRKINSSTNIVNLVSNETITVADGWTHVFVTVDIASSANTKMWFNGVEDTAMTETTLTNDGPMEFTEGSHRIGNMNGSINQTSDLNGQMGELWFNNSAIADTDVPKFINGGKPADLGSDGSTPTGSAPVWYLSRNGNGTAWGIDSSGNGNDFTASGDITDGDLDQL
jgi:hypothetical protein